MNALVALECAAGLGLIVAGVASFLHSEPDPRPEIEREEGPPRREGR